MVQFWAFISDYAYLKSVTCNITIFDRAIGVHMTHSCSIVVLKIN